MANAISLIERSTKICTRDKELIWNFGKMLQATNVSIGRRAKYLCHLKSIGENFGTPFEKARRPDVETFVDSWLKQNYKALVTGQDGCWEEYRKKARGNCELAELIGKVCGSRSQISLP